MRRKLLTALGILAGIAVVLAGLAWWQARSVLAQLQSGRKAAVVKAVEHELHRQPRHQLVRPPPREASAQTILLIGSDHRWSGGGRARSDTIILVRSEPARHRIALLSIPRDLYVAIPGHGHDRINEAFHDGGERLLTHVVRETFGIRIDHFVEVDFHGFKDLVEALGGVYLPVDQRYFNENVGTPGTNYANIDLQPGYQKLDGKQALAFARFRHTDSDLVRAARQQLLLRIAGHDALASGWDFFRMRRLALAFARATASDISSMGELLSLARAVRDTPQGDVERYTVPAQDYVLYGADYLRATPAQLQRVVAHWLGAKVPASARQDPAAAPRPHRRTPVRLVPSPRGGTRARGGAQSDPHLQAPRAAAALLLAHRRRALVRARRPPGGGPVRDRGERRLRALDVHHVEAAADPRPPGPDGHPRRPGVQRLHGGRTRPRGRVDDRADAGLDHEHAAERAEQPADARARRVLPLTLSLRRWPRHRGSSPARRSTPSSRRSASRGSAATTTGEAYVVPVIYAYDGESVFAVTTEGRKVAMMRANPRVCVEVDEYDVDGRGSWRSVIAQGVYEELAGEDAEAALALLRERFARAVGQRAPERGRSGPAWSSSASACSDVTGRAVER